MEEKILDNNILTTRKEKERPSKNLPEVIKSSFISTCSEGSMAGRETYKLMIEFIKKLKVLNREGKTKNEFNSIIPALLREINQNICEIIDDNNNTFAHLLVNEENIDLLKIVCDIYYLLIKNKDEYYDWFLKENNENLTILDKASIKCNREMLEYFYEIISRTDGSKLKFNIKKNNIFHFSAKYNQYYSILFWYDKLQPYFPHLKLIDLSNLFDITPLHYACYHGSYNCVELLIDLGADVNAFDKDGKSVLTYAVYSGDMRIVKKLLIYGADKKIKDADGNSPYNYACEMNKTQIVHLLKVNSCLDKVNVISCCNVNNIEIKQLKGERNDFDLMIYLLLYLIFIIIFSLRFFFVSNYEELKISWLYIRIGLYCLGLSSIFLVLSLMIFAYFKCITKYPQYLFENKRNLLVMYDNSNNICVKCIRIKNPNTIHCAVCNLCVDDWDHHCFWLNACINKNNIKQFVIFIILMVCLLFTNLIFSICFLILFFIEDDSKRDIFIINIFSNINYEDYKGNMLIWRLLYLCFFSIYFLIFLFLFFYNFSAIILSSKNSKIRKEEIAANSSYYSTNTNNDYINKLIDSDIDKIGDDD